MTRPRPRLGQHFLIDAHCVEDIIAAVPTGGWVVEIGPGRGALTAQLAERADQLLAIEKDTELAQALSQQFDTNPKITIRCADALQWDPSDCPRGVCLVGNLPYNISTALLQRWLRTRTHFSELIIMVQREVANRLCAQPDDAVRGQLSVITQLCMSVQVLREVPPECFEPPPKVMSTVLRLTPRESLPISESVVFGEFSRLVQCAFAARRKTLRNNLAEVPKTLWDALEIDAGRRAQTLTQEEWVRLFVGVETAAARAG